MGRDLTTDHDVLLRAARDRIATTMLASSDGIDSRLGALTLRPHQVAAVGRLLEIMSRYRGALLADAVGLGKTYVALAIARVHARPMIVCPAALRSMWARAMATAAVSTPVISTESLSRGTGPADHHDLIIVDEAHHFRSPSTRRYHALAELARHGRVLLLSATPLQNSRGDLAALLAIFAGPAVDSWDDATIARLIVRRDAATADEKLPALDGPHALSPGADDDCLEAILAVPPAVPAAGEGTAHALATLSLVHLWSSSRAALVASVRRRRARAIALRDALDAGHVPTPAELSAWEYADGTLQMVLPFHGSAQESSPIHLEGLRAQLDSFTEASTRLIEQCRASPDPDAERAQMLRTLRARHPGERCVAFAQYAHTVSALARLMRTDHGIALVTAGGGHIASGAVRREEVIAQFAGDAPAPKPAERVDLLLTTDLLSEGVDLRGASVVIHLDLPWNPARMEQRVGRSRRLGSPHEVIHVYTFVPPVAAERMIELRRRLARKIQAANAVVGGSPDLFDPSPRAEAAAVVSAEGLRTRLRGWLDPGIRTDEPLCTGAACFPCTGWIAVVIVDGLPRLLHDVGAGIADDPARCAAIIESIGDPIPVREARRIQAVRSIESWIASRRATAGAGEHSPARRAVLERLTTVVERSARHRRPAVVASAQHSRRALAGITGAGAEVVLAHLARSPDGDEAWLKALDAFTSLQGGGAPRQREDCVAGLILLG